MSEENESGWLPRVEELDRKINEHIDKMFDDGISNREQVQLMNVLELSKVALMIRLTKSAIFDGVV